MEMEMELTTAEIVALRDETRNFGGAGRQLENVCDAHRRRELPFELCLRIKNTLDRSEKQGVYVLTTCAPC